MCVRLFIIFYTSLSGFVFRRIEWKEYLTTSLLKQYKDH